MIFLSILSFRKSLSGLLKAKREEYVSIKSDITKSFCGKNPDEIYSCPDMIYQDKNLKVIKMRLPNTASKTSKRDGYRLIYLINNKKDVVGLLYTYPKNGSLRQIDVTKNALNDFFAEYIKGYVNKSLVCHDITNDLSVNNKDLCNMTDCEHEQIACEPNYIS